MAKEYTKEGGNLVVTETTISQTKHDLRNLKRIKQELKSQIDEIDILIAECAKLNIVEK